MQKKILLLCPYPENTVPGQRLKYEQYLGHLRLNGYQIDVSPFLTQSALNILYKKGYIFQKIFWVCLGYTRRLWDLARAPFYDGAYVFLHITPFGLPIVEILFRLFFKKLIYDIDDLVFLGKTSNVNRLVKILKTKSKYHFLMKSADHVITCTPYLNQYVRKFNSHTTDISSTIQVDKYVPLNKYRNIRDLTLGWSGSHSTSPYLNLLAEVLQKLAKRHAFKLLVIGDSKFKMHGVDVEAIPWSDKTEVKDLQRIDIGLYPLPIEEWVYGKSGLKALQYMALGIPTVATAIGSNFRIIEDQISGYLVKSDAEWLNRLETLILYPSVRKQLGQMARNSVEKYFSVQVTRPIYQRIFDSVYSVDPHKL